MFGMPQKGQVEYSVDLDLDLSVVQPSVAGPKRPQDRINLPELGDKFRSLFAAPANEGGYGKSLDTLTNRFPVHLNGHSKPEQAEMQPASVQSPTDTRTAMAIGDGKFIGQTVGDSEMVTNRPTATPADLIAETHEKEFKDGDSKIGHGSVLIAAITSCTNTSNPSVMLASGLVAKKAVERGLRVDPSVKTSLAPGSRVVTITFETQLPSTDSTKDCRRIR
jgi:aconitate hydratase